AGPEPFSDLLTDMGPPAHGKFVDAIWARWPELDAAPQKKDTARQVLIDLGEAGIADLDAKIEAHEQDIEATAERAFIRSIFDHSPESERLRGYHLKYFNAFRRGLETYRKYRSSKQADGGHRRSGDPSLADPRSRVADMSRWLPGPNTSDAG